jgi:hypothetical protein
MNLAMPGLKSFAANVPQRYPGETVVPFTSAQEKGQQLALSAADAQEWYS